MVRSVFLLMALLSSASADYPEHGNGLIQKDTVKAKAVTPDADETAYVEDTSITAEDAIEQAKEEIVEGGEGATEEAEPKVHTLNGYITSVLLPRATETKQMLDADLAAAYQKVLNCELVIQASEPSKDAAVANLNRQQRKLEMCLRVKRGDTVKEEEFCEEWHAAAKNFNPKMLDYAKGNLKTYENILKVYYDFYPKFMKEEAKCREMIAIMHSQDKHCSFRVGEITKVYCALWQNRTNMCNEYEGCYAGRKADLQWTITKAKELEEHTKKTYKALECFKAASDDLAFAKSIDAEPGTQDTKHHIKCDPSQYTTTHLNLIYPPIQNMVVKPCDRGVPGEAKVQGPSWCNWQPATTATTTIYQQSAGPSGGPATYSLIQDSAAVDETSFSKVEAYLADAEATLKKMGM